MGDYDEFDSGSTEMLETEPDLSEIQDVEVDAMMDLPGESEASALDNMSAYICEHNYGRGDYPEYSQDPEWQALNRELQETEEIAPTEIPEESASDVTALMDSFDEEELGADNSTETVDGTVEVEEQPEAEVPEGYEETAIEDVPPEVLTAEEIPETDQPVESEASALDNMGEYMCEHNYARGDYLEYSQDPEWQALNRELQESEGIEPTEIPEESASDVSALMDSFGEEELGADNSVETVGGTVGVEEQPEAEVPEEYEETAIEEVPPEEFTIEEIPQEISPEEPLEEKIPETELLESEGIEPTEIPGEVEIPEESASDMTVLMDSFDEEELGADNLAETASGTVEVEEQSEAEVSEVYEETAIEEVAPEEFTIEEISPEEPLEEKIPEAELQESEEIEPTEIPEEVEPVEEAGALEETEETEETQEITAETIECFNDVERIDDILTDFREDNWENFSVDEQKESVDRLYDYVTEVLQLENPPKLDYYNNPEEGDYAYVTKDGETMGINEYCLWNSEEAADTVAHELWHAYQHQRAANPRTELDYQYAESFDNYIPPELDFNAYQDQLVEADARAFAQRFKDYINDLKK